MGTDGKGMTRNDKTRCVSHRIMMHHDGKAVIGGMYGESGAYLNLFDFV